MIGLIVFIPFAATVIWLFSIRPYCRRNGKGYTPGAAMGVTYWVDWQEAGEIARVKGDKGMIAVCRLMLGLHLAWACNLLFCAIRG